MVSRNQRRDERPGPQSANFPIYPLPLVPARSQCLHHQQQPTTRFHTLSTLKADSNLKKVFPGTWDMGRSGLEPVAPPPPSPAAQALAGRLAPGARQWYNKNLEPAVSLGNFQRLFRQAATGGGATLTSGHDRLAAANRGRRLGPLLALCLAWLWLGTAPAHAAGWVIECADCSRDLEPLADRSLRLDAAGHPHVAYGGDHVYHAWHDGAAWHVETVDPTPQVNRSASLALDDGGYAHVSYYDAAGESLRYAYQDAGGWHLETVDDLSVGPYNALALDGSGSPYIAYNGFCFLRVAHRDADGWHVEYADGALQIFASDLSLAIGRDDRPRVSYFSEAWGWERDYDIRYAYRDDTGWHVQVVDDQPDLLGGGTSLALDPAGRPHISYYDASPDAGLKHAYQDAAGWHLETVDAGAGGPFTSLAFDAHGRAHIAYQRDSGDGYGELRYARRDASGWHTAVVPTGGSVTGGCSLALDVKGWPRVSYYDGTAAGLKYAYYLGHSLYLPLLTRPGPEPQTSEAFPGAKALPQGHLPIFQFSNPQV